jgi:PAS domain S-box-containing protein
MPARDGRLRHNRAAHRRGERGTNMKPLGIKTKVALATSLASVVMIALVTAIQSAHMQRDFTDFLFAQQTALINRTAEELDDKLAMLRDIVSEKARHQPLSLLESPRRLREHYSASVLLSLFDDILVLDKRGVIVADLPAVPGRTGVDASDRAYFKIVQATHRPMISEPVLGKVSGQPIVQMVAPLLDAHGAVDGMLIGVLRLYKDNMLGHLRTAKVGRSGYYFAVTREAAPRYVLHPDAALLLKTRPANANPATTRALREGLEGTVISTNSRGLRALNSFKRLDSVDWILAASLPVDEAFAPFDGVLYRLALWSFLGALLTAALVGWLTLRLLSPLVRLRDAILGLRADASHFTPLPLVHQDEIGELTSAFNHLMGERLAADARLQSLIEFAPNAMLVVDGDGRIETFNRQAEQCFGYRREQVAGQPIDILLAEAGLVRHAAHWQEFVAARLQAGPAVQGEGGREQSLWGRRQDGTAFPVEVNLSQIHTDQGAKLLAVVADITERHRLQLELEARAADLERERDRAEAANRAKSDFVANMSHEIRTPLNAVLGMAYLLDQTALTPEQRKYLDMVRVAGQSLLGILNDVLDFSKIEARRMQLEPAEFDLDELLTALAATMAMNAGDKELELAIAVEPDVPRRLVGDALRLQQVLVNLAGNAIKFTPAGEVLVAVGVAGRADGRATLRFEVRDTGIGIAPEQQAQLFTAFSQGDGSITRRFGGTGLGLAISQRLVAMMGGDITLDSAAGAGSSFRFSLPFETLAEADADTRPRATLGPLRVLLTDDNRTSRELIAKQIRAWGWQADAAEGGAAALALHDAAQAARQPYDVVLADWHMPGMDGLATVRAIHQSAPSQPVVLMVNAFARDRLQEISHAAEADAVLMKPVTASSLFDALHQALAARQHRAERAPAAAPGAVRLAGVHFLLAEDNVVNQAVARGILEHAGATLDVVGDGQAALEHLRAAPWRYRIVLMDMQMPVLDGFSATERIRSELGLTLPVIAMTAGVLESERERCIAAGISDFIAKPVVIEDMLDVIERQLGRTDAPHTSPAAAPKAHR